MSVRHDFARCTLFLLLFLTVAAAPAEKDGAVVTLNLKEADITTLIATVSEVTGRNFIVDPRVKGKVTVISSSPMDAAAVYATFLSVLAVNGFAAVPAGAAVKIVPDGNARSEAGSAGSVAAAGDELETRVIDVHNGSATQLVAALRPLVAQSGQLAANVSSNSLIVSDRAGNVARLARLVAELDRGGDREVEVVPLQNATADDIVRSLTALTQQTRQADAGAAQVSVVADTRSNSVLLGGDRAERERLLALIRKLDQPNQNQGDTQVVYLKYADADTLAAVLTGNQPASKSKSSGGSILGSSSGASSSSSFGAASKASSSSSNASSSASSSQSGGYADDKTGLRVIADRDTNALVITAPPKTMQQVRHIIEQLDIRRSQVLVEAIVAEISADKSSELGVDWLAYNPNAIAAAGILNSSTSTALSSAASTLSSSSSSTLSTSSIAGVAASLLGSGGTALVGTSTGNGSIYGALIKALASDAATNILSTPSLVTLDNEEAKIEVGQSVPELTGSYANSGTTNSSVNPFQTIDREDIGLKLGITPTIGEGDSIRLKLEFENSTIASGASTVGTAQLVTNKRTVSNTVSVDNGQILVIGGLIDDQLNDSATRIPGLSSIPVLGRLFQSRTVSRSKRNLMIFLHPVILRARAESDWYTRRKYEDTRRAQIEAANGPAPPLGGRAPVLYHYEDLPGPMPQPDGATPR